MNNAFPLLLKLSILVPFLAGVCLLLFSSCICKYTKKTISLIGFIFPALVAMLLAIKFNGQEQLQSDYAFFSDTLLGLEHFGISLKLGLNGVAMPMFLLAGLVGLAAGLYAIYSDAERKSLYIALLLLMFSGLMGTFASVDIFFFYFFHELALIPTFIMMGIWGGRGRRGAAMQLTIYLTLGAMLSLIGLIALYLSSGLNSFDLIALKEYLGATPLSEALQNNIFALLMFGFGILVSLFPFHSWAPTGYGAAPTSAAMLHAGVLKKFGLYGLIQIAAPLLPIGAASWAYLMAILALCNIVIIGLVTMAQKDLKQMIGYSSVMHMGYAFLGIACLSTLGFGGAVILMFAHGLSVALLFLLSTCIYKRTETWTMKSMGGLAQRAPILCGFFVAATMASAGLPGFANFVGEVSIFVGLWNFEPWMVCVAITGIIISAVYGLRSVAHIFFGKPGDCVETATDITLVERIPAIILILGLVVVGFWPRSISENLNRDLAAPSTPTQFEVASK